MFDVQRISKVACMTRDRKNDTINAKKKRHTNIIRSFTFICNHSRLVTIELLCN